MYRKRSTTKRYDKVLDKPSKGCPFCTPDSDMFLAETPEAFILKAKYPYEAWDNQSVVDHLLVVPKRHVTALDELSTKEQTALIKIYSDYERRGYDLYARAVGSIQRSVDSHQHTHLIRGSGKKLKFFLYLAKPYWMIKG